MDPMNTLVWQSCACKVTEKVGYCRKCFPSKAEHLVAAMKDEDTFLRYPQLIMVKKTYKKKSDK